MSERLFFEVFPGIQAEGALSGILKECKVQKVTINKKQNLLRVYLNWSRCVHKKYVYAVENLIQSSLFASSEVVVKVIERFTLSTLYTPKVLLEEYRESLQMELSKKDRIMAHMFRSADFSFRETQENGRETVMMEVTENTIGGCDLLCEFLERVFRERCQMDVDLRVSMRKKQRENPLLAGEQKLKNAAFHIAMQTAIGKKLSAESGISREETAHAADMQETGQGGKKNTEKRNSSGQKSYQKSGFKERDKKQRRALKFSDHPDVLYGRFFEEESTPIESVDEMTGGVVLRGQILKTEARSLRNERGLIIFTMTDETDTIKGKLFVESDQIEEISASLRAGTFIRAKGTIVTDSFEHELTLMSISGICKCADFRIRRFDEAESKRVELHCHTKMSDMDGVTDAAALVKRAYEWGHPAIAITDHGGVQAFPEANHAMEAIDASYRKQYEKEHPEVTKDELKKISAPFKVIYGMEGYLVDDLKGIATNSKGQSLNEPFVVFDIETTGLYNETCKIIEIGAVRVENGRIVSRYSTFVNPERPIPIHIEQLTSIKDSDVEHAPTIEKVLPEFLEFCGGAVLVAHNADFDMGFIMKECERQGIRQEFTYADTIGIARLLLPGLSSFKLDRVAKAAGVVLGHHHRAVDDAACTAEIFVVFVKMLAERDILNLDQLNEAGQMSEDSKRKLRSHHVILLALNDTGRVNLYRIVSESHLNYFYKNQAKLPKSLLNRYREGIIVGSACVAGEVFDAVLRGASPAELSRIVSYYDYLEIQPTANNAFLLADEKQEHIQTIEDLQELNRRIVRLGEQFHKPVCATCDVHFMDPKDEIYRRIIMAGKKFKDADDQGPLYLHTTDEMLEEFSYLGSEKAREVVIENPGKIAAAAEKISPIRAGKFPPVIEHSDRDLREICHRRAHEIYGETLPEIVEKRLERELNSIISNGYAVMYIIAQKLVWKSNEDGYLVGSRGSVGSSFVATMSGITEVNPLPPHYLCPACHYVDFESEQVIRFGNEGKAGCDMPDAVCPKCGHALDKLGFNIPFETFLGFKGNKEPDIDLNFSGEYQSKAHKYTEVIFGAGQTFRAGTIGTLADKTAFGYVKNYYADKGMSMRTCEIERIVSGCVGIRRTTGQHPGGIIVLPIGEDINSFTPVQHPADDSTTDIITTHFDYHSIDANLLKLDILGHDDPTMIRMLEDLTGTDATKIPLDEQKVMTLFKNTEALGVTPQQIRGCPLGSLGIPEFGTDFVIQMLQDTKPQCFSDLIRISGLSHGTDVWLGNAQTLIEEGKATISTAICTRDDIMTYLIAKGLESELSFSIMEKVRKGKGLTPEWEEEMARHGVPDWYIWSCNKIKYMFPKAHAVAYVMMAYRIAWYKIYHPLAYYAAFFSIRASSFNYEKMCMGQKRLEEYMDAYEANKDAATKLEQDMYKDMKSVQEMYARGFDFMPIDLYQVQAHRFQIIDGKLMPALDTIDGLGDKAADAIVLAARDGVFLSKEDFRRRAKVGKSITDVLDRLGILENMPEGDQISLFDLSV